MPPPGPPGPAWDHQGQLQGGRQAHREGGGGTEAVEAAAAGSPSDLGRDGKRGIHSMHVEALSPHPPTSQEKGGS